MDLDIQEQIQQLKRDIEFWKNKFQNGKSKDGINGVTLYVTPSTVSDTEQSSTINVDLQPALKSLTLRPYTEFQHGEKKWLTGIPDVPIQHFKDAIAILYNSEYRPISMAGTHGYYSPYNITNILNFISFLECVDYLQYIDKKIENVIIKLIDIHLQKLKNMKTENIPEIPLSDIINCLDNVKNKFGKMTLRYVDGLRCYYNESITKYINETKYLNIETNTVSQ